MTAIAPRVPGRGWITALRSAPAGQATMPFYLLFGAVVTLNAVGLVMVLSVSSVTSLYVGQSTWFTFQRQLVWSMGGLVALILVMRVDYRQWQKYANAVVVLSMLLLAAVLIPGIGTTANGATRWIYFGPISFQPSELAKLAMVLFAAAWLADKAGKERDTRTTIRPVLVVCSLMSLLILLQPNLGTAVIIATIAFAALFMAGVPLIPLTGWSLFSTAAAALAAWGSGYRRDRVISMFDPWSDPSTRDGRPSSRGWVSPRAAPRVWVWERAGSNGDFCPKPRPTSSSPCWPRRWAGWAGCSSSGCSPGLSSAESGWH